jgi:hypothetical protein
MKFNRCLKLSGAYREKSARRLPNKARFGTNVIILGNVFFFGRKKSEKYILAILTKNAKK